MEQVKILVVDDEKEIVQAIKKLLETQNYSVVTAYNGIEAIEVLKKEDVHIIIMDIMMNSIH